MTASSRWARTFGPVLLLIAAMISMQCGAAFAKGLFPAVGAQGVAALRLGVSALMLGLVMRPWRGLRWDRRLAPLIAYGLSLGAMNTLFYMALVTVPLGIAIALEFVGPLAVAIIGSRRPRDMVWVAVALAGWLMLAPLGHVNAIDPKGGLLALGSGGCWALYIIFGRRAGLDHGARATALGMAAAAAVFVPLGLARVGPALFAPAILPAAIILAFLSSALPYSLEMFALTRLPTRVFGTLMSLEPAIGSLAGLVLLGESPSPLQWLGISAVMLASVGTAVTARADKPSPAALTPN